MIHRVMDILQSRCEAAAAIEQLVASLDGCKTPPGWKDFEGLLDKAWVKEDYGGVLELCEWASKQPWTLDRPGGKLAIKDDL